MKSFTILCVISMAIFAAARPEEKYTDKYDNVNIDEVITNKRLLDGYLKCILEQDKCTPDGKELKSHIAEALETYCEKCSEIQRTKTRQVISHLVNNESEYWNQLTAKYDPSHKYTTKYEQELKKISA